MIEELHLNEVCSIYSSEDEDRSLPEVKVKGSLYNNKYCIDNVSTSEEGSIYSLGSSLREFASPMGASFFKSKKDKIYQINRLNGPSVYLNVFDLSPWINEADLLKFYASFGAERLIKYPNPTMVDLEFASKEDAIEALMKEPRIIDGCRFDIRISRRNYNDSYYDAQQRRRFDKTEKYYEKKEKNEEQCCGQAFREGGNILVTYTQKPKTLQTEEKIENSEKKETEIQTQEAKSESVCSLEQAIPSENNEKNKETLRVEVINSTETVSNGPESAKSISVSSATKAKAGKYRNLIKVGDKLLQMVMEPSLVEKEAQIQKEKDLEKERLEKEQREKEEEERKKKEDELKLEQLKQEEPVKAKIEYVIYKQDYSIYDRKDRYNSSYQRKWNDHGGSYYGQRDGYYGNSRYHDSYKNYRGEYATKQYIPKSETQNQESENYIQLGSFRILKDSANNGISIIRTPSFSENKQGEKSL